MKIENSFEAKVTKPFTEQHGIGLKNVKKIVEKYNGTMAVITQEGIFCVNLILYMARMENEMERQK